MKKIFIALLLCFSLFSMVACEFIEGISPELSEILTDISGKNTDSDDKNEESNKENGREEVSEKEESEEETEKEPGNESDNEQNGGNDGGVYDGYNDFGYLGLNLSEYLYLDESYYKPFKYDNIVPPVTDFDVENEIIRLLCEYKIIPSKPAVNVPNVTISVGDVANIYYRGYTVEDGVKNYFDGGCNFYYPCIALEIGSGTFIPGFEYNLIGKNQQDYATMTKVSEGKTQSGDVISFTYSVMYADGTSKSGATAIIDLSDPMIDEKWGDGFSAYLNMDGGREIGSKIQESLMVSSTKASHGTDIYFDMSINEVYRISEGERLVVEAYFPYNYGIEELNGKTAYFEVFIRTVQDYEVYEFDDSFIRERLKLSESDLAEYEGTTLAEKCRSYLKAMLEEEYNTELRNLFEDDFWNEILELAEFKKLPEGEVEDYYNQYVANIESAYQNYTSYYSSLDAFARAYLELGSNADWKATLRKDAEDSVKQRLIFYYIVDVENLNPTDAEYKELYDYIFEQHLQSYLEYYGITESSENYELKLETGKQIVLQEYGQEYFDELVLYDYVMEKIISWAKLV